MTYCIRPSRYSDAALLAPILRDEDRAEVEAAGSEGAEESLRAGIEKSSLCFTVEIDNHPHMIMGVVPSGDPLVGYIWMLSSPLPFTLHKVPFIRLSPAWVKAFHYQFPVLTNAVDARNTAHIRWLRWLGFNFLNITQGRGKDHLPFYTFTRLEHV